MRYNEPYDTAYDFANVFTFGVEIEIDCEHDTETYKASNLIAGWCKDYSLIDDDALEYQTQPLTLRNLDDLRALISDTPNTNPESRAGGHIHVHRTGRQRASRWYWALRALDTEATVNLNMRHIVEPMWCHLERNCYDGKGSAVNDTHCSTIELRTFGAWNMDSASKLIPAVQWIHTMWRFFQKYRCGSLHVNDIKRMSVVAYNNTQTASKED